VALDSDDVLKMKSDALRTVIKDNSVIYVYHDLIDGEERTIFSRHLMRQLMSLKTSSENLDLPMRYNLCHSRSRLPVQESDLESHQYISDGSVRGKDVHQVSGRRCAIGYDLVPSDSLMIAKLKV
jgi:hypothetical protein